MNDINDTVQYLALPRGNQLDLTRPLIMGILNLTPDSFSDGGRYTDRDSAIRQYQQMITEGADIIDIGGESSRPGSEPVSIEMERERVIPIIEQIRTESSIPISIDTTKAEVAETALSCGADIINDISALRFDKRMTEVAVAYNAPVILMHMLGQPKTMQKEPKYIDCIKEIIEFFEERIEYCSKAGISRDKIIIDPGIGFGKRVEDNLNILKNLNRFNILNQPILIGASRKSFIGMVTGETKPADKRIGGSLTAIYFALTAGASILRVHDVAETVEAVKIYRAIKQA